MFAGMKSLSPERRKEAAAKSVATRRANIEKREAMRQEAMLASFGLKEEIQKLEKRLAELKHIEAMQVLSCALTNKTLLGKDDIVSSSIPWENLSGVYFLISEDEVVYVGQSVNVYSRIYEHSKLKKFEKYAYIQCPEPMLDKLESLYIHLLQPKLNGNLTGSNSHVKSAPFRLDQLIELKEIA